MLSNKFRALKQIYKFSRNYYLLKYFPNCMRKPFILTVLLLFSIYIGRGADYLTVTDVSFTGKKDSYSQERLKLDISYPADSVSSSFPVIIISKHLTFPSCLGIPYNSKTSPGALIIREAWEVTLGAKLENSL